MPMSQTEKVKFLGEAPIFKLICTFSIPCILSMLTTAIYMNVDAIFVAKYMGTSGLSALSIFSPLDIICLLFPSLSMGYGTSTYISPALGRKQFKMANYYTTVFVLIALLYWALASIILLPLLPNVLTMFKAAGDVFKYGYQYGVVAIPGYSFAYIFTNSMGPILRAENRANISMVRQILGAVLNIILDAIFFTCLPQMGYYAASASTCISLMIVAVWMILNIFGLIKGGILRCQFKLLKYSVEDLAEQENAAPAEQPADTTQLEPQVSNVSISQMDLEGGARFETVSGEASVPSQVQQIHLKQFEQSTTVETKTFTSSANPGQKRTSVFMSIGRILAVSFPFYINGVSTSVCALIATYYTTVVSRDHIEINRSAVGILTRVVTLVTMPIVGLVQALTPILGFNMGAGKYDRVYLIMVYTALIGVGIVLTCWGLCQGLAYYLMYLFAGDSENDREISAIAVRLGLAGVPLLLFTNLTVSVAQLRRKTIFSTVSQLTRSAITIGCIFFLPFLIKASGADVDPVIGVFASFGIGDVFIGLASLGVYVKWTLDYKKQQVIMK